MVKKKKNYQINDVINKLFRRNSQYISDPKQTELSRNKSKRNYKHKIIKNFSNISTYSNTNYNTDFTNRQSIKNKTLLIFQSGRIEKANTIKIGDLDHPKN